MNTYFTKSRVKILRKNVVMSCAKYLGKLNTGLLDKSVELTVPSSPETLRGAIYTV